MITRGGMAEIAYYRELRKNILLDECFKSLPKEYQEAIIMSGYSEENKKKLDDIKKKLDLKRFNLEEKVKEKVLTYFKKNI